MSDEEYDDSAYDYDFEAEDTPTAPVTRPLPPQNTATPPRGTRPPGRTPRRDPYENDEYTDDEPTPVTPARPVRRERPAGERPPAPRPSGERLPGPRRTESAYDAGYADAPPPAPRRRSAPPPDYYPPDPPPRGPQRPARPVPDKRRSGLYLPWWSLLIMLVFVGCAAVGALLVVNNMELSTSTVDASPVVIVITSTFTVGPPASETPISLPATLTPTAPLPTIAPTGSLPPGNFAIGKIVEVVGVGASGLNVRSGAGVGAPINFQAKEGDHFVIQGGPQTIDGSDWWQIQDQNNPTGRSGWASRNYLETIDTPTPPPTVTPISLITPTP